MGPPPRLMEMVVEIAHAYENNTGRRPRGILLGRHLWADMGGPVELLGYPVQVDDARHYAMGVW